MLRSLERFLKRTGRDGQILCVGCGRIQIVGSVDEHKTRGCSQKNRELGLAERRNGRILLHQAKTLSPWIDGKRNIKCLVLASTLSLAFVRRLIVMTQG